MLKNKLIRELYLHLCLGHNVLMSEKVIFKIFQIIKQHTKILSPLYIIETGVFNLIIPIYYMSVSSKHNLRGNFLKQSIIKALISIIKYSKHMQNNQSTAEKLALIFIQLHKKDHILYKQKKLYINKILNL